MSRVTLVHVGMGTVGGEAIEQVIANRDRWWDAHGLDVRIGAVIGLGGALVTPEPDGLGDELLHGLVRSRRAGQALREAAAGRELVEPPEAIALLINQGPVIVMDAAAGDETAPLDARALASGAGVVLSNKAPLALPLHNPLAAELWATAGPRGHLRYEATCGAGLPVISTLRSLLDSGDEPIEIVGALSGTLGAIFTDLGNRASFSQAVRSAKANGFTEPDPRDDLSGLDVARKALILARTIGRQVNLEEIAVENLVPEALQDCRRAGVHGSGGRARCGVGAARGSGAGVRGDAEIRRHRSRRGADRGRRARGVDRVACSARCKVRRTSSSSAPPATTRTR